MQCLPICPQLPPAAHTPSGVSDTHLQWGSAGARGHHGCCVLICTVLAAGVRAVACCAWLEGQSPSSATPCQSCHDRRQGSVATTASLAAGPPQNDRCRFVLLQLRGPFWKGRFVSRSTGDVAIISLLCSHGWLLHRLSNAPVPHPVPLFPQRPVPRAARSKQLPSAGLRGGFSPG